MTTLDELRAAITDGLRCPRVHFIVERGPHYIQLAFDGDMRVLVEVVSNQFLSGEAALWDPHVEALKQLGWREPTASDCGEPFCEMTHPNFWRFFGPPAEPVIVASAIRDVATSIFGAGLSVFALIRVDAAPSDPAQGAWS